MTAAGPTHAPGEDRPVLIYATAPDEAAAERIVDALFAERLIACANVWPGMTAHYVWNGQRQKDSEVVLVLKTRASLAARVVSVGRSAHPYEMPAFVVLDVAGGYAPFLDWIMRETAAEPGSPKKV